MKATSESFTDYQELLDWLFVQLPNYQAQGTSAYKPGLDTITSLLKELKNPHDDFKSIHLAGTNGKGSTAHMLASVYQEAGLKVGIFTSPHISDFRERVKVNGQMIAEQQVIDFVNATRHVIDKLNATFFEITTALAFKIFSDEKVDIAIVETGLGGRLDSTNVLLPELSIITTIGLDHTQFLGDTIEEIASEKGGIIKESIPVVLGKIEKNPMNMLLSIAKRKNAQVHQSEITDYSSDLKGAYQIENLRTAAKAIKVLQDKIPVDESSLKRGFENVIKNTSFFGRFQVLGNEPTVIMDAAHNSDGVKALMHQLSNMRFEKLHCIYGGSNDKDLSEIFNLFPKTAEYHFCTFESVRSISKIQFEEFGENHQLNFETYNSSLTAYKEVLATAQIDDLVIIFGSFYIFSQILEGPR